MGEEWQSMLNSGTGSPNATELESPKKGKGRIKRQCRR